MSYWTAMRTCIGESLDTTLMFEPLLVTNASAIQGQFVAQPSMYQPEP